MTLLADDERVYKTWRTLVHTHQVPGVQVHDARLSAAMLVHNVPQILTFNSADFARFPGIKPFTLKRSDPCPPPHSPPPTSTNSPPTSSPKP